MHSFPLHFVQRTMNLGGIDADVASDKCEEYILLSFGISSSNPSSLQLANADQANQITTARLFRYSGRQNKICSMVCIHTSTDRDELILNRSSTWMMSIVQHVPVTQLVRLMGCLSPPREM